MVLNYVGQCDLCMGNYIQKVLINNMPSPDVIKYLICHFSGDDDDTTMEHIK